MHPIFRILADGIDATQKFNDRLVELVVNDEAGQDSDTVEIIVHDRDFAVELPREGALLSVALGYQETGLSDMGLYTVDEWTIDFAPDRILTIRAKAADMLKSQKVQKTRAFEDKKISEIVKIVAGDHGLDGLVDRELSDVKIPYIAQTEESDLHFLTRLGRQFDAVAKPAGGKVLFAKRAKGRSVSGQRLPLITLGLEDFIDGSATGNGRPRFDAISAHWHDRGKVERVTEKNGSGDQAFTLRHSYQDKGLAGAAAKAKKDEMERAERSLTGTILGNPIMVAEAPLNIVGIRSGIDGIWLVKSVSHRLSEEGYVTEFQAEIRNGGGDGKGGPEDFYDD